MVSLISFTTRVQYKFVYNDYIFFITQQIINFKHRILTGTQNLSTLKFESTPLFFLTADYLVQVMFLNAPLGILYCVYSAVSRRLS